MTDEMRPKSNRGRRPLPEGEGYTRVSLSLTAPLRRGVEAAAADEGDWPEHPEMVRRLVVEALAARGIKIS